MMEAKFTAEENSVILTNSLGTVCFSVVIRVFFVNISKVIGMKTDGFIMKDFTVPISRTYMKEAQKQYRKYLGNNDIAEEDGC